MNKLLEYIKGGWKIIVYITSGIGIIASLFVFDARYAKMYALEKMEKDVVVTIQEVKKSIQLQQDINRLDSITDQMMKAKLLMKTYPKDKDLKEDYESLKIQKDKIKQSVEEKMK
jgi:hypothetical protein